MAVKKLKRTYITKSGKVKTYEYDPKKYNRKGTVLVDKKGRVITKAVEELKNSIRNNDSLTEDEKISALSELDVTVKERKKSKRQLTTSGFAGHLEDDPITRLFANAGYSVEEAAGLIDEDPEDVLNPKNWNGLTYKNKYKFEFRYTGAIWRKI